MAGIFSRSDSRSHHDSVSGEPFQLELWDTYKPEEHDRLRALAYPNTNVVLVCFSVTSPATRDNVQSFWLNEIDARAPGVPWLLIGMKTDLRADKNNEEHRRNKNHQSEPVTTKDGIRIAKKLGAVKYLECSALEHTNVQEIFEEVRKLQSHV